MSKILTVRNLKHTFTTGGKKVNALNGVSFELNKGELTSIVGPSGCGKSTLMYLLGLLDKPESGEILLNGLQVSELNDLQRTRLRRNSIGFVFQFHFLIKELTARENVALPAQRNGMTSEESTEKANDILHKLGLSDKAERFVNKLSGGEQQRVAIARALVNSPSLLLADEPTGNLDTENSDKVFKLLKELSIENKLSVLLVTHNSELANKCDNFISMKDGAIVNSI